MGLGADQNAAQDDAVLGVGALSREALADANINPNTGLATDYLNHFNEVVMLMEMLPDMPDCVEDVLDWAPSNYTAHFQNSAFKDKDLAVLAYAAAPTAIRAHLETLIMQIDHAVIGAQDLLRAEASTDACAQVAVMATHEIKPLISAASGTINGTVEGEHEYEDESVQAGVDALFG
jgi:hypothetical protein